MSKAWDKDVLCGSSMTSVLTSGASLGATGVDRSRASQTRYRVRQRGGHRVLDTMMAVAAVGGMVASVMYNLSVRTTVGAGSDIKTLYASIWNFTRGLNAYSIGNFHNVFRASGVIYPETWFGRAPVYPPTSLATLAPLAAVGMVPAIYGVILLSGVLFAVATAALLLYAEESFSVPMVGRIAIAAFCGASPMLSFALSAGNLSVATSALLILGFVRRKNRSAWVSGALISMAFLLKPHLAFWIILAMFCLPERAAQSVAKRATILTAGAGLVIAAILAGTGTYHLQMRGLADSLRAETAPGFSMNVSSREVIPVYAQITSLPSLVGFWGNKFPGQSLLVAVVLLSLGLSMLWRTRSVRTERQSVIAVAAWACFGLLATYHRAHDGLILLLLLPWLVEGILRYPKRWHSWAVLLLYMCLTFSAPSEYVQRALTGGNRKPGLAFVLLRQASLASGALFVVLLAALKRSPYEQFDSSLWSTADAYGSTGHNEDDCVEVEIPCSDCSYQQITAAETEEPVGV